MATLNICQSLATAMGPSIRKHVPTVGPNLLSALGDSKVSVITVKVTKFVDDRVDKLDFASIHSHTCAPKQSAHSIAGLTRVVCKSSLRGRYSLMP